MYFAGDTVNVSDAIVHAVYSDGTEVDVTSQCTFNPAQGTVIGSSTTGFDIVATWVVAPASNS